MAKPAALVLQSFNISKILFERQTNIDKESCEYTVNIKHAVVENPENNLLFNCFFRVDIKSTDEINPLNLQIETVGSFLISAKVSKEVEMNYKNVAAPMILYPYVRSFISSLSIQSGLPPIILATMNFVHPQNIKVVKPVSKQIVHKK